MFDLDGTLIDTLPDISMALDRAMQEFGYAAPGEGRARAWVGNGSLKLLERALAATLQVSEEQLDKTLLSRLQQQFFNHYELCCDSRSCLYEGVHASLMALSALGVSLACVTNKPGRFTPKVLAGCGIEHFFDYVISGDTLVRRKPYPDQLNHVMSELGVEAANSIMVGDSINDIQAARAADVSVVCVDYGYNYGQPLRSPGDDQTKDLVDRPDLLLGNMADFFCV